MHDPLPGDWQSSLSDAVARYWKTLETQKEKRQKKKAEQQLTGSHGSDGSTGGKQMDGFLDLFAHVAKHVGVDAEEIHTSKKLELPGYYRPAKRWDMLITDRGRKRLVAALEFKSQCAPSFGNNFNNRAEEAIGSAHDLRTAYKKVDPDRELPLPWLGWIMLVENHAGSTRVVKIPRGLLWTSTAFDGTGYLRRYEILMRNLVDEGLYDATALVTSTKADGRNGEYNEPAAESTMRGLLCSFAERVAASVVRKSG